MNGNELAHHGVLGMKWGVRRYQNKDGTLTPEGRRRLKETDKIQKEKERRFNDVKKRSTMTTDELRKKVEKLRLEKELNMLTREEYEPGKAMTERLLKEVGTRVASTVLVGTALYGIKAALTKNFNVKDLATSAVRGSA